jgi:hypothetical protein
MSLKTFDQGSDVAVIDHRMDLKLGENPSMVGAGIIKKLFFKTHSRFIPKSTRAGLVCDPERLQGQKKLFVDKLFKWSSEKEKNIFRGRKKIFARYAMWETCVYPQQNFYS